MKGCNILLAGVLSFGMFGNAIADLNNGLVAYYPFDGNVNDASENGNNGIEHGGVSYGSGRLNQAASFDGIDDYIDVTNITISENYTISIWSKTHISSSSSHDLVSLVEGDNHGILIEHQNGQIRGLHRFPYGNSGGENIFSQRRFDDNQWHHIALKMNNGLLELIIDGTLIGSETANPVNDDLHLIIGKLILSGARYYNGFLDELRIYNRSLSLSEINQLYNVNNSISDECWATYENGKLHIPCIKVKGTFGEEIKYEADMQYKLLSEPMSFELTDAKQK